MSASEPAPRHARPLLLLAAIAVLVVGGGVVVLRRFVHHEFERGSKTIEARSGLQDLALNASRAYERDKKVCLSASRLVPSARQGVGVKYISDRRAWERDAERRAGFACLGFSLATHYYRYEYVATEDTFTARAYGADAEWGIFEIQGRVVAGRLALGGVHEIDPKTPEPPAQDD